MEKTKSDPEKDIAALTKEDIGNSYNMTVRIKYGELWNTLLKIEWDKRAQKQWDPVQDWDREVLVEE